MTTRDLPTSWAEANERLGGKNYRTIANNTTLERLAPVNGNQAQRYETIGIRLHRTVVVYFHNDGYITLNSGGWHTVTTAQRLNVVLKRHGYTVGSNGKRNPSLRRWVVSDFTGESPTVDFFDGLTIKARSIHWTGDAWKVSE